jgi:hypothetical protein
VTLLGFDRARAIAVIGAGRCPCDRCSGQLTDPAKSKGGWGHCFLCGCAWQVSLLDGHEYAATIPSAQHRPVTPAKSQGK